MVKVKLETDDKGKKAWIVLPKESKEGLYYDGILLKNLNEVKELIKKDWDYVYVIDGEVGSGKSWFAAQLAHYVSNGDVSLDDVTFLPDDFKKKVIAKEKYKAVIFDEAFRGLSSRAALSETNKTILEMLNEIRQKNLFIFIVLPSIWDLDSYVSRHRCKGLFHIHTDLQKNRGFFKFYRKDQIEYMWANRQKMLYRYPTICAFKGRFTGWLPFDEKEYKKKKNDVLGVHPESEKPNSILGQIDIMKKEVYKWKTTAFTVVRMVTSKNIEDRIKIRDIAMELEQKNSSFRSAAQDFGVVPTEGVRTNLLNDAKNCEKEKE